MNRSNLAADSTNVGPNEALLGNNLVVTTSVVRPSTEIAPSAFPWFIRQFLIAVLCMAWLAAAGCAQAAVSTPQLTTLTIAGATAMHPVLHDLTEEFNDRHPYVVFALRGGGSTLGEEQVAASRIDLAASTLLPTGENNGAQSPPEATNTRLVRTPIGIDGIAVVVHARNPITGLTVADLQALYAGDILTWDGMGDDSEPISLISREDGSGTRHLFESQVMDDKPVSLTSVVMPTSKDVVEYVARTPTAIGYVSRAFVIDQVSAGADGQVPTLLPSDSANRQTPVPIPAATDESPWSVRVVAIDGTLPIDSALVNQSYPLIQPLYLITAGEPEGWVREFIDFVLSPAGQRIVERYHVRIR